MEQNNTKVITFRLNQEEQNILLAKGYELSALKLKEKLLEQDDNVTAKIFKPAPKMQHQFAGYTFVGHFPDEQVASGMLAVVRNKFGRESTFESGSPEYQSLVNADYEPYFKPGEVIQ